ncbi:MAG: SUMF1/EgtB/PvdO family nonheme iron enzyme [Gammaproteobacteria bacterium]|nr:SUMF1/EgtB/PvdO family nonheme iron enzyme [Gammaproteobacteria bacterium]
MSTSLATMIRLRAVQNKIRNLFEDLDDNSYRLQFHPDLSPAGWHLGHCMFIENYWLHEVIQKNNKFTRDLARLYLPENCPKPERGPKLPRLKKLLADIHQQQDENDLMLIEMIPPLSNHPLFKDEYIENFIIQHYAQHYETVQMVFNQMAIKRDKRKHQPRQKLQSAPLCRNAEKIPADEYSIGGESNMSYDNELPQHKVQLNSFHISQRPVSNAEYLHFMEHKGYSTENFWSKEGWQWREQNSINQPEHWQQNEQGDWYGINYQGAYDLAADEAVYGISYYEACAYANWAAARLPHEHEWETAVRNNLLHNTGQVWEWCSNTFYPYPEFKAFPYDEYSKPWFDDQHYVLRGASQYTRPEIRRASFRNFFNADKRHIFAGLRLVFE